MFLGLEFLFILFLIPFGLLATAFWIWMVVDAARNNGLDQNERIVWIVVIALTHVLGAILYLCLGRSRRKLVSAN